MRTRPVVTAALLAAPLLLAACSGGSDDAAAGSTSPGEQVIELNETPMSAEDTALLDKAIAPKYKDYSQAFPAVWVGVWHPQRGAYVTALGEAEVGGAKATLDDFFRIGSVTKSMTATILLQLVNEGKLSLDDTVAKAAPAVATGHPDVADLTIRQLLGMTSGLPDYLNVPDGVVAGITEDPSRVWSADELIDAGLAGDVQPAGTAGYSTTNYIALQQVAEEITGTPLRDLIAQRITGPLGMTGTSLPANDDTALPDPASHGYLNGNCVAEIKADGGQAELGQDVSAWNASYGQGGGGAQSTISDLGRWGASMLGSALLSDEVAQERLSFTPLPEGVSYGLGIMDYGDGYVGHSGEAIGWQAQVAHDPTTGITIAAATNACSGADELFEAFRFRVTFALNPPSPEPSE